MATTSTAPAAVGDWLPTASGSAKLQLSVVQRGSVRALGMDYEFRPGGGFVVARRAFPRAMPQDYAVRFRLRGRGTVHRLEVKLIDEGNQNVWRHVIEDLAVPCRWKSVRIESQQFDFAWGPASGSSIARLGFIEFAVVAAQEGAGTLWLADVDVEDCTPTQPPHARASSALPGLGADGALSGAGWRPHRDDRRPWLVVDSNERRTLGGLVIDWLGPAPTSGFLVQISNAGRRWKTLYSTDRAAGAHSYVYLPGVKTRYLRLRMREPTAGMVLHLKSFEFSRSIDAFWYQIAAADARGLYPRWLHREQSLWTPIGTASGDYCAVMNDDGMVEALPGACSLEPLLWIGERLVTWSDVKSQQALLQDWMPVPSVTWECAEWRLRIDAQAAVGGALRIDYRVENRRAEAVRARLFVVVRPFQVTPPWQAFRRLGGVSRIHALAWREGAVQVDRTLRIVPKMAPAGFGAACFDEGNIASYLAAGKLPERSATADPFGFASGALDFPLELPAHGACHRTVVCTPIDSANADGEPKFDEPTFDEPTFDWSRKLPLLQWSGNGWITDVVHTALTATAHILVTRSGPALQPGPRRYTRSWIRDGAMMSAALLRMGLGDEVRQFIQWYAPHQRLDGFVPCCVDRDGIDWLVEHDSHGELIALIADYHRFTLDAKFLAETWSFIDKAVGFIARSLGPEGLLPISVSHEGYLAQPVHSYWDNFWALRGLRDAAALAEMFARESAAPWAALAARFAGSLSTSVETTRAGHRLAFIPGSIEWADFDPTATANALYLLGVPAGLDRAALERTFDMYLADWRNKRNGTTASPSYTPYEIRIIGALVRLGRRAAALELLAFFLGDRRPRAWNQWPEIAWRDRTAPAHLGDIPHTWIAAEYVLAVRSLFAYEDESDRLLVVAAGLAPEWIDGVGVNVDKMPTLYGALSYSLRRLDAGTLQFRIATAMTATLELRPPLAAPLSRVLIDDIAYDHFDEQSVTLPRTPAVVTCIMAQASHGAG
jgi:hypothetical protein